jgi:hypothetical protein
MRTSLLARYLTACFGVWFAFAIAEPVLAMHECPVHDGILSSAPGAAHHGAHQNPASHKQSQGAHQCSCLGECAGCTPVALAATPDDGTLAVATVSSTEPPAFNAGYRAAWAQHILPFQNGPPAA